jgi:hypothetical protein
MRVSIVGSRLQIENLMRLRVSGLLPVDHELLFYRKSLRAIVKQIRPASSKAFICLPMLSFNFVRRSSGFWDKICNDSWRGKGTKKNNDRVANLLEASVILLTSFFWLFGSPRNHRQVVIGDATLPAARALLGAFGNKATVWAIDDGAGTLLYLRERIENSFEIFGDDLSLPPFTASPAIDRNNVEYLNIYTIFGRWIPSSKFENVFDNVFQKQRVTTEQVSPLVGRILIAGNQLVGPGLLSRKNYISVVSGLADLERSRGKPMVYLPHPRESDVLSSIKSIPDLNVFRASDHDGVGLEALVLGGTVVPSKIYTFPSTVAFSLRQILAPTIDIVVVDTRQKFAEPFCRLAMLHNQIMLLLSEEEGFSVLRV